GRVRVVGTFLHDKEFYLAARSLKDEVGLQVVTPLSTAGGTIVLFDRGWIPSEKKDPAKRAQGQIPGKVELIGIVRRSQVKRSFAPDNDPARNFWFHVDVPLMRQMAGGKPDPVLDGFFLEADATANPGGLPVGGQTRLDIPNDHLQYAITWFLIALAGIGVYLAYHWENGRLTVNGRSKVKA
ncbi:MAG TPA: SURF1 family cytochrome oxidase biogenesis protein, partial [Acetobacteraceae bacterium]|nr:SURF1 family cytochrome oxidase biogenesis protein [Acetobacteraceae bacterium]